MLVTGDRDRRLGNQQGYYLKLFPDPKEKEPKQKNAMVGSQRLNGCG